MSIGFAAGIVAIVLSIILLMRLTDRRFCPNCNAPPRDCSVYYDHYMRRTYYCEQCGYNYRN